MELTKHREYVGKLLSPHHKHPGLKKARKENKYGDILFSILLFFIIIGVAFVSVYYAMPSAQQNQQSVSMNTTYSLPPGDPTLTICTTASNIVLRMKVSLRIILLGSMVKIPARIGMSAGCTRPIYTKDLTGTIYIESPITYPFALRDFFGVWNEPFNKDQIFSLTTGVNHRINMTVNGLPNYDFEGHIFQDGEQITITYQ
jgi:preprotein translocase subunit YajC